MSQAAADEVRLATSGKGTSATFTRRSAMSEVHSEADISRIANPAALMSTRPSKPGPTQTQQYGVNGNVVPFVAATVGVVTVVVTQGSKKHTSSPGSPVAP